MLDDTVGIFGKFESFLALFVYVSLFTSTANEIILERTVEESTITFRCNKSLRTFFTKKISFILRICQRPMSDFELRRKSNKVRMTLAQ